MGCSHLKCDRGDKYCDEHIQSTCYGCEYSDDLSAYDYERNCCMFSNKDEWSKWHNEKIQRYNDLWREFHKKKDEELLTKHFVSIKDACDILVCGRCHHFFECDHSRKSMRENFCLYDDSVKRLQEISK